MNADGRPRIVVMGVSAVGKSTVGAALAAHLEVPFLDADCFHAPAAVAKMSRGEPLNDRDREPWLRECGRVLNDQPEGAVLACSALARRYRRTLRAMAPDALFIHLAADLDRIRGRAAARQGHFMPPALLQSQFAALEPLGEDERGMTITAGRPLNAVMRDIMTALDHPPVRANWPK